MELESKVISATDERGDDINISINETESICTIEMYRINPFKYEMTCFIDKDELKLFIDSLSDVYDKIKN